MPLRFGATVTDAVPLMPRRCRTPGAGRPRNAERGSGRALRRRSEVAVRSKFSEAIESRGPATRATLLNAPMAVPHDARSTPTVSLERYPVRRTGGRYQQSVYTVL